MYIFGQTWEFVRALSIVENTYPNRHDMPGIWGPPQAKANEWPLTFGLTVADVVVEEVNEHIREQEPYEDDKHRMLIGRCIVMNEGNAYQEFGRAFFDHDKFRWEKGPVIRELITLEFSEKRYESDNIAHRLLTTATWIRSDGIKALPDMPDKPNDDYVPYRPGLSAGYGAEVMFTADISGIPDGDWFIGVRLITGFMTRRRVTVSGWDQLKLINEGSV